jgi:hypothetical protein
MIVLCDQPNRKTPKTADDQVADMLNEIRKLGGDTSEIGSEDDIKSICAALAEAKVYFRFSTTETPGVGTNPKTGKPYEPRTWENWHGGKGLENYQADEPGAVQDDTGGHQANGQAVESENVATAGSASDDDDLDTLAEAAGPPTNDDAAQETLKARARLFNISDKAVEEAESWQDVVGMIRAAGPDGAADDEPDLDALATAADDEGDADAIDKLTELAEAAGLDPNDYPDSWADLAEALKTAGDASEEPWSPKVKEVYKYKPDPKKRAGEYEVTAVNVKNETVELINCDDKKTRYKAVPWAKLIQE